MTLTLLILLLKVWSSPDIAVASLLPRQSNCIRSCVRVFDTDIDTGQPDTVHSGNYRIYNCADQAPGIIDILQTAWQVLQPSLADVNASTSSDAYNAFFKQVSVAPTIATVISNIATGAAVRGAHFPRNKPATSPIIMCANDPSKNPNKNGLLPSKSSLVRWLALGYNHCDTENPCASYISTTSITILCPEFFTRRLKPSPGQCMSQTPDTKWYSENGGTLRENQVRRAMQTLGADDLRAFHTQNSGSSYRGASS